MISVSGKTSNVFDMQLYLKKEPFNKRRFRRCNLCHQSFKPEFRHQLFCKKCRKNDDSYNFHEWLPQMPEEFASAFA